MPRIGIVDDRDEQREEIVTGIELSDGLPEDWKIIAVSPLPEIAEYPSWIIEQEIAVLIVDEKLNENLVDGEYHAGYFGHDLINSLREQKGIFTDFPIFVITAYDPTAGLSEESSNVEYIIQRKGWIKAAEVWVPRIVRAGQRYFQTYTEQLATLGRISQKLAVGDASEDEIKELDAIRTSFELPFNSFEELKTRSDWIKKFEGVLEEFQDLKAKVQKDISNLNKKN